MPEGVTSRQVAASMDQANASLPSKPSKRPSKAQRRRYAAARQKLKIQAKEDTIQNLNHELNLLQCIITKQQSPMHPTASHASSALLFDIYDYEDEVPAPSEVFAPADVISFSPAISASSSEKGGKWHDAPLVASEVRVLAHRHFATADVVSSSPAISACPSEKNGQWHDAPSAASEVRVLTSDKYEDENSPEVLASANVISFNPAILDMCEKGEQLLDAPLAASEVRDDDEDGYLMHLEHARRQSLDHTGELGKSERSVPSSMHDQFQCGRPHACDKDGQKHDAHADADTAADVIGCSAELPVQCDAQCNQLQCGHLGVKGLNSSDNDALACTARCNQLQCGHHLSEKGLNASGEDALSSSARFNQPQCGHLGLICPTGAEVAAGLRFVTTAAHASPAVYMNEFEDSDFDFDFKSQELASPLGSEADSSVDEQGRHVTPSDQLQRGHCGVGVCSQLPTEEGIDALCQPDTISDQLKCGHLGISEHIQGSSLEGAQGMLVTQGHQLLCGHVGDHEDGGVCSPSLVDAPDRHVTPSDQLQCGHSGDDDSDGLQSLSNDTQCAKEGEAVREKGEAVISFSAAISALDEQTAEEILRGTIQFALCQSKLDVWTDLLRTGPATTTPQQSLGVLAESVHFHDFIVNACSFGSPPARAAREACDT